MRTVYLPGKQDLHLIQITDTHLNGPTDGHLLGMKTLESLDAVLAKVRQQQTAIDAFLVTGDISQDGSADSYQHLQQRLADFSCPNFWLAGNHDAPDVMAQLCEHNESLSRCIRSDHWQLILLDSQVLGKVYGQLKSDELAFARRCIEEQPQLHTLITLHHHPLPVDSHWLDQIGLSNGDELLALAAQYPQVRCLLWGHVHQAYDQQRGHTRLISSPSTCVQFKPASQSFSIDEQAPGYRWLRLRPDGEIETAVERVEGIEFEIDYSVKGY